VGIVTPLHPHGREEKREDGLEVTETGAIQKLGCGFLFAFYSNYGRIFSHFGYIQRQRMA